MKSKQLIDRKLTFFWTSNSTVAIPEWLQENINQWSTYNPNLKVEIINDNDTISILSKDDPELCQLYSKIAIPACRSDIARVLWLYKHGGMYVDVHTACKGNVDELLQTADLYDLMLPFHPEHLEDPELFPYPLRTGVLIARKGGIFLQKLLEYLKESLLAIQQLHQSGQPYQYNVSGLTGPHFIASKLRRETDDVSAYPSAHCRECAKLEGQLKQYNAKLIDIEDYVAWHQFSSYRMENNRYSDNHWTVLQTRIKLFK